MSEDKELFGCDCGNDDGCGCGDDDGCGCGCGDHDHEEEVMTITLEDGKEVECAIIAIFPVEEKDYIALLPLENQEDGEVYLYGFEEYESVTKAFDEILDDAELDELFDEDDEEFEEEDEEDK